MGKIEKIYKEIIKGIIIPEKRKFYRKVEGLKRNLLQG